MLYDQILILCGKYGISIARLERELNMGNGTVRKWKTAKPTAQNLLRVAGYFGIPAEALLGQDDHSRNEVQ